MDSEDFKDSIYSKDSRNFKHYEDSENCEISDDSKHSMDSKDSQDCENFKNSKDSGGSKDCRDSIVYKYLGNWKSKDSKYYEDLKHRRTPRIPRITLQEIQEF